MMISAANCSWNVAQAGTAGKAETPWPGNGTTPVYSKVVLEDVRRI
ncbi:hypothetical protein ACFQL7_09935 [Halocatena marina]|uniref:Uncharacterized protein n=1 Tax=Halocatena marina TaxID=2934937 RepID=A0ABD5YSE1_9EURY